MTSLLPRRYKTVPGRSYGTPKELWGFRTAEVRGTLAAVARRFLRDSAALLGIQSVRSRLRLARVVESVGAAHVIFQQGLHGRRIHRACVTVHMDRRHRVFLAKNRAVPAEFLPKPVCARLSATGARRRALRAVRARGRHARLGGVEQMWYPLRETLQLAYRVRVHVDAPREEWTVYVNARSGAILGKYDNLASAFGSARVFDPNPVVAAPEWQPLSVKGRPRRPPPGAYRKVRLPGLHGTGFVDGPWVTTRFTKGRVRRSDQRFEFASTEPGFDEAMVYFHVDRVIRYLESLGYRGDRAIFREPLDADVHGTPEDNSWYSSHLRRLTFGTGRVDDAEDAEIIVHEFGHALQDAICPAFGQSQEAATMGEGFGDYLAASFFADRKPPRFRASVGSWDSIEDDELDPRCLRRVNEPLTYESFDHSEAADEHDNGQIWSATLWKIRTRLGRDVADRIIIESHFQLDGFTSFAKGARAILDADRHLFRGRHVAALRRICHE
jgi:Zn-dependent metalloprotease